MAKKKPAAKKKKRAKKAGPKGAVLVTGAAGFTGSTTVDLLIEKGYSVVATDREDAIFFYVRERQAMLERERGRYGGQKIEIVPADLTKRETLRGLFRGRKIKYVLHAGAVFDMSAPWKLLYNVNVMGTKNLLEVATDAQHVPEAVVIWSTAMVYGEPQTGGPVREDHPKNPVNYYARSKWEQELMAMTFLDRGLRVAAIRPSTVYGPRSKYGITKSLIPLSLGFLVPVVPVPGSGRFRTNYVHVDDVVGAGLHLAERINARKVRVRGEAFNVSDDIHVPIKRSVAMIAKALHVRPPAVKIPKVVLSALGEIMPYGVRFPFIQIEKEEIPYMFVDTCYENSKLKSTGYRLKYPDPEIGMYMTLKWYARNKKLPAVWYVTHPDWESYWQDVPDEPLPLASQRTAARRP